MPETYEANPELYRQASPIHHLDASDPPTLTLHGTIDSVVEIEQGDALDAKLEELGIVHQYDRVEGWTHVFDMESRLHERTKALMYEWLDRYMAIPET
jgi:dipeptidyl aminopeptidase/acylaminoacyl peptidase